ncbi:MAG: hypothetical protein IT204_00535 [Fimbriimonadaceae bacterium]|nr:hypothetical protein [Fimbriimonadaceae bacterium]
MPWSCRRRGLLLISLGCLLRSGGAAEPAQAHYFAATFPEPAFARFAKFHQPLDRQAFVRQVVADHFSALPPEAFDLAAVLGRDGQSSRLQRGLRLGLVTGSVAYCGALAAGGDSWLYGSLGLAAGVATAAASDLNWPPTFTLRSAPDQPWQLGLGWLSKPACLPRHNALPSWHSHRSLQTAGIGLSYRATPDAAQRWDCFLDPFAAPGASLGGVQWQLTF